MSKSKKINVLFFNISPNKGGAQLYAYDIASNLNQDFNPVFCFFFNGPFKSFCEEKGYKTHSLDFPLRFYHVAERKNILSSFIYFSLYLFFFTCKLVPFLCFVKKNKIDIIYGNDLLAAIMSFSAKIFGVKVFWHVHEYYMKKYHFFYKLCLAFADRVITLSDRENRNFTKLTSRENLIVTVYNSLNPVFQEPPEYKYIHKKYSLNNDDIVIGTISRINPDKGLEYFIESAEEIIKRYPACFFFIVGKLPSENNSYYTKLKKIMDKYSEVNSLAAERIIFTDFIDCIAETMYSFDIFVLASVVEPFGRVLIEASYLEKPVVASKVGGIPEAVIENETAFLVPPADPERLTEKIIELIENPETRRSMGQKGKQFVEKNFLIKENIKNTERLFYE